MAYSDYPLNPFRNGGPNFGLLDARGSQDMAKTQIVQAPQAAAQNEEGLLKGLQSLNQSRETGAKVSDINNEIADRNARLGMEQQLQPGRLQQQQATLGETNARTKQVQLMSQGEMIKNKISEMELGSRELEAKDYQELRKVAPSGYQAYQQTLMNQGNYGQAFANDKALGSSMQEIAKGNTEQVKASLAQTQASAGLMAPIMQMKDPNQQSQAFKQALPSITRFDPKVGNYVNVDDPKPQEIQGYGAQTLASFQMKQALLAAKNGQNKPTAEIQNAQRLAQLSTNLQKTPEEIKEQEILQKQLNKSQPNEFDKQYAQVGMKQVTQLDNQTQALKIVHDDAVDAKQILAKIPEGYLGPIVDYLKANNMNSDIQKLQKLTAGIPIAVKAMYGVTPGNRLTTTELQQLNKASGSTAINKDALNWVLDRLIPQTEGITHENWQKQDSILKHTSPDVYKNWQSANPEPDNTFNKKKSSQQDISGITPEQAAAELSRRGIK